jgi:hypothetical protein
MDRSAVKAIVEAHLESLVEVFGVERWCIQVNYEACDNPNHGASCGRAVDYDKAFITIDPDKHKDEGDVVDSLRHEIEHILLSPFDLYRDAMTQHIDDETKEHRQEQRLFTYAVEQTVINIERLWCRAKVYHAEQAERERAREGTSTEPGTNGNGRKEAEAPVA